MRPDPMPHRGTRQTDRTQNVKTLEKTTLVCCAALVHAACGDSDNTGPPPPSYYPPIAPVPVVPPLVTLERVHLPVRHELMNQILVGTIACAGLVLLGGCATDAPRHAAAAATTPVPTTTSSVAPLPPVTITVPAPLTVTVPAPPRPAPQQPQVVPRGQTPCQWLGANGYSYETAYLTWVDYGYPLNWDADKDGYPCEQTYGNQN